MATEGGNIYSCCSPCLDDGRNTVARHYCVDCGMYFCSKCVTCHNIIPLLRKHQVHDVYSSDTVDAGEATSGTSERGSDSIDSRSMRCTLHEGKRIDTFCKNHNKVFCGTCAMITHRSCTTLSIEVAAKDFKASPVMKKFKETLTKNLALCKQEEEKRADNINSIDQQKLDLIENVDRYEETMIAKIKDLANISRDEIRSKCDEPKKALGDDIKVLNVLKTTTAKVVDKLEPGNEEQHLLTIVKSNEEVVKDGETLLEDMTKTHKERAIQFHLDKTLETRILGMKSLGRLECIAIENKQDPVVKEYEANFDKIVNIMESGDNTAQIFGICVIDSGEIVLTDYSNQKLKRFNADLQLKDSVSLSGRPVGLCKTDKNEVAVRIQSSKIVSLVSVDQTLQITTSFTLAGDGYGMTYDAGDGEIFACEGNKVSVYNKTGTKLRTYDKDSNGKPMFSKCRQIALSDNGQDIYVTDETNGLIVLDKNGTLKQKVSLSGVRNTFPLCLLPDDISLTGDVWSNVIYQVDKTGRQVGNPIKIGHGQHQTYCAVYDREHSRLLIGGYPKGVFVYKITAK